MENLKLDFVLQNSNSVKQFMHPSRNGEIWVGEKNIGCVYELNPLTAKKWDLNERVGVLELNLNELNDILNTKKDFVYASLPEFPIASRDLAFTVDKKVSHLEISIAVKEISPLLQKTTLFDVYEGEHVKEGGKSMAYHFVFSDSTRTLKNEEVEGVMGQIIEILKKKFGAEVRG